MIEREPPACPVCDGGEHGAAHVHDGMTLYPCAACGTLYLWPPPSAETIRKLYTDAYDGATAGYFSKVESKMRRSRRRIARLSRFARAGGRFLDIGCNGGFVVEAARERGFDAWGVDIDPVSIRYAEERYPKNRFRPGPVEAFEPDAPRFDLVYCSEVIEHVPAARSFAAATARLLAPGGVLFVTTPDLGHWRRPSDLARWDAFSPPGHCVFFRASGLRLLMEREGLRFERRSLAFKPGLKMLFRRPSGAGGEP